MVTCVHCGKDLGKTSEDCDEYDLYKGHIHSCDGKEARAYRKAIDEESQGFGEDTYSDASWDKDEQGEVSSEFPHGEY